MLLSIDALSKGNEEAAGKKKNDSVVYFGETAPRNQKIKEIFILHIVLCDVKLAVTSPTAITFSCPNLG